MGIGLIGRILLSPVSFVYGLAVNTRNLLYEAGLLKSTSFSNPIISVGNLSVGGAGKTPHVEYLIRLLQPYLQIGVLSRGYKRKSKGFRFVTRNDNVLQAGDEPLQYARKFNESVIAVSESRALGIPLMLKRYSGLQTIILDDAFQHLSVTPAINILLTPFDDLYTRDYLLPAGRLRENVSSAKRANIVVVTKCPKQEEEINQEAIITELQLEDYQQLFFSYYEYGKPYSFFEPLLRKNLEDLDDVILISAIANTSYLEQHLESKVKNIHKVEYEDHHLYSEKEIENLSRLFKQIESDKKCILTTEKDATRLELHFQQIHNSNLPIFVLPIEVHFHFNDKNQFDDLIKELLLNFKF